VNQALVAINQHRAEGHAQQEEPKQMAEEANLWEAETLGA